MFDGLIKKMNEQKLNEQDDLFTTTNVRLDVYMEGKSIEHDDKISSMDYRIELEYRSWGIKGVYVSFPEPITFEYWEVDEDGNEGEHKEIEVDLREAEVWWSKGGQYGVDAIVVSLNADGTVKDAHVEMDYLAPDV